MDDFEVIKDDGRPFSLNKEQISFLKEYLSHFVSPPKKSEIREFVKKKFGVYLNNKTFDTFLAKIEYKSVKGTPMEENRFYCNPDKILFYYHTLMSFVNSNNIPSALCLNFDEEGHEPFSDAKKDNIIVPLNSDAHYFPVARKRSRTTFLASIAADGTYLKPLLVTKRKTIETSLLQRGLTPRKVMLEFSENGYVTERIFNEYLNNVIIPYITNTRKELGDENGEYTGKGLIICDGFSGHISDYFFQVCKKCNMQVFFLPSHSSHITQPLDLGLFAQKKFQN